jgi:hypothetical protein
MDDAKSCCKNKPDVTKTALEIMEKYSNTFQKLAKSEQEDKALKYDSNKEDLSIISYDALKEIAKALEFGSKKYGRYNYLQGMKWTRISSAALRHLYKWIWISSKDEESNLSHLAHLGACVIMLLDYETKNIGEDDRYGKT